MLLVLTGVSLTFGLELTASTGNSFGSSSTGVTYGATIKDALLRFSALSGLFRLDHLQLPDLAAPELLN